MSGSYKPLEPIKPLEKPSPLIQLLESTYARALQTSINEKKILIVGVNCNPPSGNWVTCRADEENFPPGRYLVISKNGQWLKQLPFNATAEQIHRAFCSCGRDCLCPDCNGDCPKRQSYIPQVQCST